MQASDPQQENEFNKDKKALSSYSKYSAIVMQMIAIIGVFAFIGYKLDAHYHNEQPLLTALCCVIGVCLSLYQTIRQLKS